jgi:hypothetical protein
VTLLAADDSAYLVEDEPQRYVLGDPADPLLVLNGVDEHGVMWACEEPQGWDAPAVLLPVDRKQSGHGGVPGAPSYEERVLSFSGSAEAPTPAEARRARTRLLRAILGVVRTGEELLYTHLDDEPAKSLYVLPSGDPRVQIADGRWLDYAFVLVAGDPIKRGTLQAYGPVRLPSDASEPGRTYTTGATAADRGRLYTVGADAATRGRTYPGGGNAAQTVVTVPNDGDEDAHARFLIAGPVPSPMVVLGTGEFVALDLDLGDNDAAAIDTEYGTVEVNGVNRIDALAYRSTFPLIPPGGVEVRLRSRTGGTSQAAGLTIETAPRWT